MKKNVKSIICAFFALYLFIAPVISDNDFSISLLGEEVIHCKDLF